MSDTAVWKISLSNLSRNLLEATELANVLQEVSSSIQVTGLSSSLSGRTSTSTSGTPTKVSTRERLRNAVPIHIGTGAVPWEQLVAVASSDALQDHSSLLDEDKQPQVLEVNTGGTVFFLFFKLKRKPQQHHFQKEQQQQQQQLPADWGRCSSSSSTGTSDAGSIASGKPAAAPAGSNATDVATPGTSPAVAAAGRGGGAACAVKRVSCSAAQSSAREGIAVLKVGFNRLAMQAEQFANELTRHLGIAAPDCRIVRQVGSTADEWGAALEAVNRLAGCSCQAPAHSMAYPGSTNSSFGGSSVAAHNSSSQSQLAGQPSVDNHAKAASGSLALDAAPLPVVTAGSATGISATATASSAGGGSSCGGASGCIGCSPASFGSAGSGAGAAELLAELSRLPCFLLMAFVEGDRLSDSPQALHGHAIGQLLEDVGCLFLLDMLLGNADRMPCADLGWRGNANNLLYGAPGTRHEGRPVAIDSCVARRPPASKASAEDAAVERLAQLLLAVPDVSRSLLQQLLGNIKLSRGRCSRLSSDGTASTHSRQQQEQQGRGSFSGSGFGSGSDGGARLPAGPGSSRLGSSNSSSIGGTRGMSESSAASGVGTAGGVSGSSGGSSVVGGLVLTDEDLARFQAGLKKCLNGVTQIKGLLETVSNKVAEWIAEFVADVVKLNPAVLPAPAGAGTPSTPPTAALRSPRPSPRPSARNLYLQGSFGGASSGGGASSSGGQAPQLPQHLQQQQPQQELPSGVAVDGSSNLGPPSSSAAAAAAAVGTVSRSLKSESSSTRQTSAPAAVAATASGVPVESNNSNTDSISCPGSRSNSGSGSPAPAVVSAPQLVAAAAAMHRSPSRSGDSCMSGTGDSSNASPSAASVGRATVPANAAASADWDAASAATAAGGVPGSSVQPGLKHNTSPSGKVLPLARRAVSHLGFASIKAAICSTDAAAAAASGSTASSLTAVAAPGDAGSMPPQLPPVASSSNSSSMGSGGLHGDVAIAVAAALSPRATQAQTQALAGVFGGGGFVGADGMLLKQSCARRVTWGSIDENQTPTKLSPHELFGPPAAATDDRSLAAAESRRAVSCIFPPGSGGGAALPHSPGRSSNGSTATGLPPPPLQQQQGPMLSRHFSFPVHTNPVAAAAAAALASPVQQRNSSSSLQVLASIQLDATLASIKHEARHDGALADRLAHWKAVFREKGAELSEAIASWQARHHLAAVLSTGFLDGSHPIVDAYELGVRLQHMLRRLTALAAGAMVQAPICVLPGVFLGNAVAADSHHLLQYLGVTHVVNAAQELQVESAPGLFQVYRVSLRDEEEEDVAHHFYQVQAWIDAALSAGGAVLVHCHEGKSRSVALLLAYLMISRGHSLATALAHIKSVRPEACPNAGFMAQLMALDKRLHGTTSLSKADLPRAKPEARTCSICGAPAGLSYASLLQHMKTKHKAAGGVAACGVVAGGRSAGAAAAVKVQSGKVAAAEQQQ